MKDSLFADFETIQNLNPSIQILRADLNLYKLQIATADHPNPDLTIDAVHGRIWDGRPSARTR